VNAVFDDAVRAARRERIERVLDADGMIARSASAPWLSRLLGFAEGSYRHAKNEDVRAIQRTEFMLTGAASTDPHSFTVAPGELGLMTRADVVGTTTAGGYLVDTFNLQYAPYPQPVTAVVDLVEQMHLGPGSGNITVPTGTASVTPTYQPAESAGPTDSTLGTGQVASSPHTLIATTSFSRLLGLQSTPSVNAVIGRELANALRAAVSAAILNGSGSAGAPHGVLGSAGVGTGSGATLALAGVVGAQQTVANGNGIFDPLRTAFVASPDTAALLMQRFTSPLVTPLWDGDINTGMVRGIPAFGTKSMSAATLLYGDFSTVLLVIWGGVQIQVDPFQGPSGSNFQAGLISVRIAFTFDVILRHPVSFYVLTAVT
jgi:HK97 family phage major capsid protein